MWNGIFAKTRRWTARERKKYEEEAEEKSNRHIELENKDLGKEEKGARRKKKSMAKGNPP